MTLEVKQIKRILALLLAAVLTLALTGCDSGSRDDEDGSSVILATSGEPYHFYALSDEGCAGDDNLVLSNVYDCLTFLEADGSISPGLAESWSLSEDGLCYTFYLREGVKFHNGYDFTAEDVKFTFDKGAAGPLGSALFVNFKSCEIVDDYTVNIYLSAPYAGFLFGVASRLGGICSKAYYDEVGDAGYLDAPVGTGPVSYTHLDVYKRQASCSARADISTGYARAARIFPAVSASAWRSRECSRRIRRSSSWMKRRAHWTRGPSAM